MAQIGFTHKTEEIYNRFQAMRREYELLHGRTYAPDFLAVLMDAWEGSIKCNSNCNTSYCEENGCIEVKRTKEEQLKPKPE